MTSRTDFDTPWKTILDRYLQPFMEICYPEAAQAIDWSKGYEPLDKELSSIMKGAEIGNREVDKLFKVWRIDGQEAWVLIHIDVQTQKKPNFEERMFIYHYRLFNRYKKSVVSIAILADEHRNWRPSSYEHSLWGCELFFKFVSIKLLDFESQKDALIDSTNPFAIVILAHIASLKTRKDDRSRFSAKLSLTRSLYDKDWDKIAIIDLYSFIDWLIALPEPLEVQYLEEIERFEEENHMAYITSAERMGIQKGIQQGLQQGLVTGEKIALLRLIRRKFGEMPSHYQARINQADDKMLLEWLDNVLLANCVEEVFETE